MNTNKLKTQDFISIGIYTAIYFVLMAVSTLLCSLLFSGYSNVVLPGCVALLGATPYLLLCQKVSKRWSVAIMATVNGLFFLISGHFYLSFFTYVVFGVLADLIASSNNFENKTTNNLSFVVFSFCNLGPILPLWLMREQYITSLLNKGKDQAYIDSVFANVNAVTMVLCIVVTVVLAVCGLVVANKIIAKHFTKQKSTR